jgi:hypothetical protein
VKKLTTPLPDILARIEMDPAARALVEGIESAAEGLAVLEYASRWSDAVLIFAQALPRREAVWWACVCARSAPDPGSTPANLAALTAADGWVRRPTEDNRRAAFAAAQAAGMRSAEAWAAVGAFWSGGSIGPENVAEIPPGDHLCGVAVASSVTLAATRHAPEKAREKYLRALVSAYDIAQGGGGWLGIEDG